MESIRRDDRNCHMSQKPIPKKLYALIAVWFLAALTSCGESPELEKMFFEPDPEYFDYRITSPDGGEVWSEQSEHEITWSTGREPNGDVQIYYSINAGASWQNIGSYSSSYTSNDGSYNWTIPDLSHSSDSCLIRVQDYEDENIYDTSDEYLSLVADSTYFQLSSPNGGEVWLEQTEYQITWGSGGDVSSNVKIYYSLDAGTTWINVGAYSSSYTSNSGRYNWTIPDLTQSSDSCLVKVQDYEEINIIDVSDEYLGLVADSTYFQVTSPNGEELWADQTLHEITWNAGGDVSSYAKIYYSLDAGTTWINVGAYSSSYTNNDGSYNWTVPEVFVTNSDCSIKIVDHNAVNVFDTSDNDFTITAVDDENLISITSPNGGEIWHEQSSQSISWTVSGDIGGDNVKIQYSLNSGSNWQTVTNSTLNDGNYEWSLPDISELGEYCLIKISSYSQSTIYDVSDNYFSVSADQNLLQIISPNGGENLLMGSQHEITWTSSGNIGSYIKLYYSSDGGNGWYTIDSQESNDGSFQWTTPTLLEASSTCLLKIEDYSISEYVDISDNYFNINPNEGGSDCDEEMPSTGSGEVSSPADGITINLGASTAVNWTFSGPGQVNIHLYSENIYVSALQSWAINNGAYNFNVSNSLAPGGCYQIVIVNPYDSSDYIVGTYFTIQ